MRKPGKSSNLAMATLLYNIFTKQLPQSLSRIHRSSLLMRRAAHFCLESLRTES